MKNIVVGFAFLIFLAFLPNASFAQVNPSKTGSARAAYGDNNPGKYKAKKKKKNSRKREKAAASSRKKTLKRSSMGYPARLE